VSEARAREDRPPVAPASGGPPGARPGWTPRRPPGLRPAARIRPGPRRGPPPSRVRPRRPATGKAKPLQKRREERAGGPIPVRGGGRIYDVDDFEEQGPGEEDPAFDDIAKASRRTTRPPTSSAAGPACRYSRVAGGRGGGAGAAGAGSPAQSSPGDEPLALQLVLLVVELAVAPARREQRVVVPAPPRPSSSTRIWSALRIVERRCAITNVVRPWRSERSRPG